MINPASQPVFLHHQTTPSIEDDTGSAHSLSRSRRNIGEPAKYWPQNSTIKIAMYDYDMDDEYVLAVKKAAGEFKGYFINREKEVQAIFAEPEPMKDFPRHLNLRDQGLFAIGYYHKRKDLWASKKSPEEETSATN